MSSSPLPLIETKKCRTEGCSVVISDAATYCVACATPRRSAHSLIRDGAEQALASPIDTLKRLQQRIAIGAPFTVDERDIAVGQLSGVIAYLGDRQ